MHCYQPKWVEIIRQNIQLISLSHIRDAAFHLHFRWKPWVMYKIIILHLTFTSQQDEVSTQRTVSYFTMTELSEWSQMWSVQQRTPINCFQGILQISNLWTVSRTFITLACKKKHLWGEKLQCNSFWKKGPFYDAGTGGFPAHEKTAEIISFLWGGVWSGYNFKWCFFWVEINAIMDFRNGLANGKIFWLSLFFC